MLPSRNKSCPIHKITAIKSFPKSVSDEEKEFDDIWDLAVLPASSKFSDEGRNFFVGPRQDLLVHVEQVLVAMLYNFFILSLTVRQNKLECSCLVCYYATITIKNKTRALYHKNYYGRNLWFL